MAEASKPKTAPQPGPLESIVSPQHKTPESPKPTKLVAIDCDLLEPFDLIWFRNGQPKEVVRISPWLQMQIDACLIKVVE